MDLGGRVLGGNAFKLHRQILLLPRRYNQVPTVSRPSSKRQDERKSGETDSAKHSRICRRLGSETQSDQTPSISSDKLSKICSRVGRSSSSNRPAQKSTGASNPCRRLGRETSSDKPPSSAKFKQISTDNVAQVPSVGRQLGPESSSDQSPLTASANVKQNPNDTVFELPPYKLHKLDKGPPKQASLSSADALKLYHEMVMMRRIETACSNLYKEKVIRGFCHLYSGQEAVAVGLHSVMRKIDTVITAYRCHAWTYCMDGTALGVIAELTGRKSGCARGKGGSMHMYGRNFFGGNGIVGAQVPLGAGIAFAHKYRGDGGICFTLYGDGAANQGQLFEAFNIAKLWMLPVVFVCENNRYGLGTHMERSSASTAYYSRGDYIPGIWVDGMDVLASREAARFGIDWCIGGKGPIIIEMETYRYFGHSMSDPGTSYRTRDEVKQVRETRDPITSFKKKLLSKKIVTAEQLKDIETKVRKHVDEATKRAKTDPEIGLEELSADVYADPIVTDVRGTRPDAPLSHISLAKRN